MIWIKYILQTWIFYILQKLTYTPTTRVHILQLTTPFITNEPSSLTQIVILCDKIFKTKPFAYSRVLLPNKITTFLLSLYHLLCLQVFQQVEHEDPMKFVAIKECRRLHQVNINKPRLIRTIIKSYTINFLLQLVREPQNSIYLLRRLILGDCPNWLILVHDSLFVQFIVELILFTVQFVPLIEVVLRINICSF